MVRYLLGLMVSLLAPAVACAQEPEYKLPNGPGKPVLEKICSKCHDLEEVVRTRNTRENWEMVVDEMIARGAEGTDQEIELIIDYLSTHFGKINVNKATLDEMVDGLEVSKQIASAILAYREKNGPFKEWTEFLKVPGLDLKRIEDKKGRVIFK
jgi:competence protein ComEA